MRRISLMLLVLGCGVWLPSPGFGGKEDARVVEVAPRRQGNLVVCHLKTTGLPVEKQLQTMRSGLVSSVEVDLALLDEKDHLLAGNTVTLRLAFDLWEEVFSVREDGRERRFHSLADLEDFLADLHDLPVAGVSFLEQNHRYRLRVGMVVNAIAPEEQKRVEGVIAGDQRLHREGQDQQEASVSLGRLIRLFYKNDGDDLGGSERHSSWFRPGELAHETD